MTDKDIRGELERLGVTEHKPDHPPHPEKPGDGPQPLSDPVPPPPPPPPPPHDPEPIGP